MRWYKYTKPQIEEALEGAKQQSSAWSWVTLTTAKTREYTISRLLVLQAVYLLGVALIFCAELASPTIDRQLLYIWLIESIANFALRMALYARQMNFQDLKMANKPIWRLVPPFNAIVVGLHWAWTASIFIGNSLTFTTLITILVFILVSIGVTPLAPASPLGALIYGLFLWIPMSVQLARAEWVGSNVLVVLLVGLVALILLSLWVTLGAIRRYLVKSDEVNILVSNLEASNKELESLRADAAYQLQTRSQFFSGASHDFRQRLHAMKLLTHTVRTSFPNRAPDVLIKLSDAMADLETYVSDVLEFAKLESKVIKPNLRVIHLQDVFQKLELQFEDIALANGVDLRIRPTNALLETDEAMLLRILENLVSNAVKFTRGRVLVGARPCGNSWSIEVWDRGEGIPPGTEEAIFEAFYQHSVYADSVKEGVGLGLSIVRRLAHCLNCSIGVQSRSGKGSVLKVLVPRAKCEAHAPCAQTDAQITVLAN